jgi:hypothetical protein
LDCRAQLVQLEQQDLLVILVQQETLVQLDLRVLWASKVQLVRRDSKVQLAHLDHQDWQDYPERREQQVSLDQRDIPDTQVHRDPLVSRDPLVPQDRQGTQATLDFLARRATGDYQECLE